MVLGSCRGNLMMSGALFRQSRATSYYRLNDHMNESAHQLFGTVGLADLANLPENQLRHVFQLAMAADDDR